MENNKEKIECPICEKFVDDIDVYEDIEEFEPEEMCSDCYLRIWNALPERTKQRIRNKWI